MTETTKTKKYRRPAGRRDFPINDTVSGALDSGRGDVEGLRDEMADWKDNLEGNNMSHLPKFEEVEECHSALDSAMDTLESIDVPDHLSEEAANYTQDTRTSAQSRSGRLSNALNALSAAKDAAESWMSDNEQGLEVTELAEGEEADDETITQEMVDERQEQIDSTEAFINEMDDAISELENANFPGMY